MNTSTAASLRINRTNIPLIASVHAELDKKFKYYTDPQIYLGGIASNPLAASTTTCCATGTCDCDDDFGGCRDRYN